MIKTKQYYLALALLIIGNLTHFFVWFDYAGLSFDNPYTKGTDADQYIQATENLINKGELSYYHINDENYPFKSNFVDSKTDDRSFYYAFRTPGFNFIHYPLRLFLNDKNAIFVFLIIQVILSAIAKLLVSHYLSGISKAKQLTFWLLVTFFILDINLSFINTLPLTESMGCSFLIFSFYLLFSAEDSKLNLFFSGLFFIVAVFFRPYLIAILLLYLPYLIFKFFKQKSSYKLVYFSIPIILIFGTWTIRNYMKSDRFVFLATTIEWLDYTNKAFVANQDICFQVGLSHEFWVEDSPSYWINNKNDSRLPHQVYPSEFCTSPEVEKKLIMAKRYYLKSTDKSINVSTRKKYEDSSATIFKTLSKESKETNKFMYQVNNRIKVTKSQFNPEPLKPFINLTFPLNLFSIILEILLTKITYYFGGILAVYLFLINIKKFNSIFIYSSILLGIYCLFVLISLNYEKRELFITNFFLLPLAIFGISEILSTKRWWLFLIVICPIVVLSCIESFHYLKF